MFVLISEFLIKMLAFAIAFYFVLEYVFACEVQNWIGLLGVIMTFGQFVYAAFHGGIIEVNYMTYNEFWLEFVIMFGCISYYLIRISSFNYTNIIIKG